MLNGTVKTSEDVYLRCRNGDEFLNFERIVFTILSIELNLNETLAKFICVLLHSHKNQALFA